MSKWFSANKAGASIAIHNDIGRGGVTADAFIKELQSFGPVKTLNISIASDGGDIAAGFAIYNVLSRHPARKIVTIEGLAASMASVIAMAGDEIVMPSNSMLMIHNPWGSITGGPEQIVSFGEALDNMRQQIVRAYQKRTKLSEETITFMMDRETWLTAEDAVDMGFADRVEEPMKMAAHAFDVSKFKNAPQGFGQGAIPRPSGKVVSMEDYRAALENMNKAAFQRFNDPPRREQ